MQILLTKPKLHNIILFGHLKNEYQETYRSGHNELDSKSSCRATGTWVRIPPSPLAESRISNNHGDPAFTLDKKC